MEMELSSLIIFLVLFISSSLCYFLLFNPRPTSKTQQLSSTTVIKGYPVVGNLPRFIRNIPRMLEWSAELLSASPSGTVTLSPFIFTSNPQAVGHTAKSNFENYTKPEEIAAAMQDFFGYGILNVNGDQWRLQRKMASYEFNAKSIRALVDEKLRRQIDARLIPLLKDASRNNKVLDLQELLERFAFDNICNFVLGVDPECLCKREGEGERVFKAFDEAAKIVVGRGMKTPVSIWRLKELLNVGSERRLKQLMAAVHEFIEESIRSKSSLQSGFLSRFVDDEHVRDIAISFVLAGRDTTPSALTWFFWNISTRPDVVAKIQDEIKSVRSHQRSAETSFTVDEIREMNYLHVAITESLRLYPPVPLLPRKCMGDDVLPDGTEVKKGWMVMYNAYAMARSERIWGEDCREFRPERWLDEEGGFKPRNVFEYPVFHAGPRLCLGKDMAYMQMKAVAARILEGFEVEVVEERGNHELGMTMRMKQGLPVKMKERGA